MKLSGIGFDRKDWIKPVEEYLKRVEDIKDKFLEEFDERKNELLDMLDEAVNTCGSEEKAARLRAACDKVRSDSAYSLVRAAASP